MFPRDRYGAIPFGIFFMLALWSPAVTLLFCVSQAAVVVVGAVTTWRRTRLALCHWQHGHRRLWHRRDVLEPLVHREKWEAWKRHMEGLSFGDMLLMRHIPRLQ